MTTTPDAPAPDAATLLVAARPLVRSDPGGALRLCAAAARAARMDRSRILVVESRSLAADALLLLARPEGAARLLRRVTAWHRERDDAAQLTRTLSRLAQALLHADRHAEAEAVLAEAARRLEPDEDSSVARHVHVTRGSLAFRRERPREALQHFRLLARLSPSAPRTRAILDTNAANSLSAAGRSHAARRRFSLARAGFVAAGSRQMCSFVDQNEAYACLRNGDLGDALTLFDSALEDAEDQSDLALFSALCLDRAELFLLLAMPAEARREVDRLLRRVPRLTQLDEAHAAFVAAFAVLLSGRSMEAARTFEDVAADYALLGSQERAAHCRILAARALLDGGSLEDAALLVEQSRHALPSIRDPRRVSAELLAAEIACRTGRLAAARDHVAAARAGGADRLSPWVRVEIARAEADIAHAKGDDKARRRALLRAADEIDAHMGRLPIDEYVIPFLSARSWLYEALVTDYLADGAPDAAFEALERGRARALLEILGAPTRLQSSLDERRVARRRRELGVAQLQFHEAATRPDGVNPEQIAVRRSRLAETMRSVPTPRAATAKRRPVSHAALPIGVTLLEYAWLGDRLHAFIASRDGVRHVALGVDRRAVSHIVRRLAFQFRSARTRPDADTQDTATRRALEHHLACIGDAVWRPLADDLPTGPLVIVPAEELNLVPFHALAADDTSRVISYAPSATSFVTPPATPRATGSHCSVFAHADDAAPAIADEARDIASIWHDTDVLAGRAATTGAFRDRLASSRIVHVATHGTFEETAPLFSSVRLADGWVNAYDVYGLRIGAELVILAACESARSIASRDADLLGLIRALLVAGAGNVLAPQWPVSDVAAKMYVVAYFEALRSGSPICSSARRAAAITRAQHPHPADWAVWFPYCRVASGDGRHPPQAIEAPIAE